MIPHEFKKYLYDSKFEALDLERNKDYIIARVLDHGGIKDFKKIKKLYSKEEIIHSIIQSSEMSVRSAYFFKNYYQIKEELVCLRMRAATNPALRWNY